MPKTEIRVARTTRKGALELGLAAAAAVLTVVVEEVANVGLSYEHALVIQGVAQVALQAVRRTIRDRSAGLPTPN